MSVKSPSQVLGGSTGHIAMTTPCKLLASWKHYFCEGFMAIPIGSPIKNGHRGFLGRGWRLESFVVSFYVSVLYRRSPMASFAYVY